LHLLQKRGGGKTVYMKGLGGKRVLMMEEGGKKSVGKRGGGPKRKSPCMKSVALRRAKPVREGRVVRGFEGVLIDGRGSGPSRGRAGESFLKAGIR